MDEFNPFVLTVVVFRAQLAAFLLFFHWNVLWNYGWKITSVKSDQLCQIVVRLFKKIDNGSGSAVIRTDVVHVSLSCCKVTDLWTQWCENKSRCQNGGKWFKAKHSVHTLHLPQYHTLVQFHLHRFHNKFATHTRRNIIQLTRYNNFRSRAFIPLSILLLDLGFHFQFISMRLFTSVVYLYIVQPRPGFDQTGC